MQAYHYPLIQAGKWGAEVYHAGAVALPAFHEYIMGGGARYLLTATATFGGQLAYGAASAYLVGVFAVAIPTVATAAVDTLSCSPP